MGRGRLSAGLVAAVALASVLRLTDLGLMEFKGDEAVAIELALPLVEGRNLPRVGLMSSVGVHNPPLFVYAVALPASLDLDPRFVTGGLIGLANVLAVALTYWVARRRFGEATASAAALLFALAPWAVLYGRKLWAQDLLPPLCVALLWVCMRFWETPKTRLVCWLPVLLCALFQLHYSAVGMIAMAGLMLLLGLRRIHVPALLGGVAVALLMLAPYLHYQVEHDYRDLRGLANMAAGKRANGKPRKAPKPWTLQPVRLATAITTDHTLAYAAGPSEPTYRATRPDYDRALAEAATRTGQALLVLGIAVLLAGAFRPRHEGQAAEAHRALALWVLGFMGAMLVLRLEEQYPHYFIILYPGMFLVMALPIGWLWAHGRVGKLLATVALGLVLAGNLTTLASFHRFIRATGGTAGDYGVAYEHKAEVARWLVGNRLRPETRRFAVHYLWRMTDDFGDNSAIAATVNDHGQAPKGATRAAIFDTLRAPRFRDTRCRGRQDFGPLVVCPR